MVSVDKNKCIGCGMCVSVCSQGFEMGSDGKAHVKDPKAPCAKKAAEACPVEAIKV